MTTGETTQPTEPEGRAAGNRRSTYRQLHDLLSDETCSRDVRLARLAGWRGDDIAQVIDARWAQRLAPAACGVGAIIGGLLQSPVILGLLAATALYGAVAANHPFEMIYNALAARLDRPKLPPARAARRLGCAIGFLFLTGAAVAFMADAPVVGLVLSLFLGALATFVAVTNVCVPSMVFTLIWGTERATAPTLRSTLPTR